MIEQRGYPAFSTYPAGAGTVSPVRLIDATARGARITLSGADFVVQVQISNARTVNVPDHLFTPGEASWDTYTTMTPASPPLFVGQPVRFLRLVVASGTVLGGNVEETTQSESAVTSGDVFDQVQAQLSPLKNAISAARVLSSEVPADFSVNAQAALNPLLSGAQKKILQLEPGTYSVSAALARGKNSAIWGSENTPGTTVITSTITDLSPVVRNLAFVDPYVGNQGDSFFGVWLRDVEIKGTLTPVVNGQGQITGYLKQNAVAVETANSSQRMENVRIGGWARGVAFAPSNNFLQVLNYCTISNNTVNLEFPAATTGNSNSGENIAVNGGFYGGADTCFSIQKGWSIRMISPSIDYNKNVFQFVSDTDSRASTPTVDLVTPHIEDSSGNPFLQGNFGHGGGNVSIWGGVFLRNNPGGGQLPLTKANMIDPTCGPFHSVSLNRVRTADRIFSGEWSTSQVNPAGFALPIDYENLSGITEVYWVTVNHAPTESDPSFFELRAGITTLSVMGASARPAGTPAGHSDLLSVTVPPGQKWGAIGQNVTVTVRRQGDS